MSKKWNKFIKELGYKALIKQFNGDKSLIRNFIKDNEFLGKKSNDFYIIKKIKKIMNKSLMTETYQNNTKNLLTELLTELK